MTPSVTNRLFSSNSNNESLGGEETVVDAIYGALSDADVTSAVCGEAELRDYGGAYSNDLKVVVPLSSDRYEDPSPLTFDLPESLDDDSDLIRFIKAIGADPAGLDELGVFNIKGTEIPVERVNGSVVPRWDEMEGDEGGD